MILVPKQTVPSLHIHMAHRRQFSAPAPNVVVQPTRTPGLLSLSKPPRSALQQRSLNQQQQHLQTQQRQPRTVKPRQPALTSGRGANAAMTTNPLIESVPANAFDVAKDIVSELKEEAQTQAPSHQKQSRGRPRKTLKDKTPRRVSPAPRPQPRRQPSPPTEFVNSALSDPFIVTDSDSDPKAAMTPFAMRPTPAIASRPNGDLATRRRRQQPASPSPTPSKAVPVPGAIEPAGPRPALARSDPAPSHMPARPAPRRSQTSAPFEFPLSGDSQAIRSPPATPTRGLKPTVTSDHPRSAPLSFPFSGFDVSPSKQRRHARTPSESVLNLPFHEDEDVFTNPRALLTMLNRTPGRGVSFDGSALNKEKDASRLFASSMFQNSPSPDELPPPCF